MIAPTRDSLCSWCQMGAHTECSACTCTWERDTFYANRVCEWCDDGDCACHDEIVASAEDSVEGQWKALRDAGADELTLRALAGDR